MKIEDADVEAGFPLADDQETATFPEFIRGLKGLSDDPRYRVACMLYADFMEHPGRDDVRAARSMADAFLQQMTALGSVVTLIYSMPASHQEDAVGEAVNHLTVRSNVAMTDPRHNAITALILGVGKTESRTM